MRSEAYEVSQLPWGQQRIRGKCWHPTGTFIAFRPAAIEDSIPGRFEEQARRYPHRLAVKTASTS
jgi:hypothetical protein